MSEAFTGNHLGIWRILGSEDSNELPGLLSSDEPGSITLELSVPYEQFSETLIDPDGYHPTVVGRDDRGTEYSIMDCSIVYWSAAPGNPAPSCAIKLKSTRAIAGHTSGECQTKSIDKLEFSTILLRSPRLVDWWHVPGPDTQRSEDTITEIRHTPTPVDLGFWGDISLKLVCQPNVSCSPYPRSRGRPQPTGQDPDIYLSMTSASDRPLQDCMRLLEMVCTFASIALQSSIDAPAITAYSNSYTIKNGSGTPAPLDVDVLWPLRGCTTHLTDDRVRRLLSVESQANLIAHMLGRWHDNYERLEPNAKPLLDSSQHLGLPQPERFLAYVSALEGLHRIAYPEPRWSDEKWNERVESVINGSASKKLRKWALGYLKNSNEPNLPMRLIRLCDDSGALFICHNSSAFFGPDKTNRTNFVNETVHLRNKFAHSLPQPANFQEDVHRLDVDTGECEALLLVSLFKYLGWTDADATMGEDSYASEWHSIRYAFRYSEPEPSNMAELLQAVAAHRAKRMTARTLPK
ncbi:MAG: HEPN domain-containing protein [Patescibacteria group bacterium]